MPDAPASATTHHVNPFPDVGGVYLLVAGIVLGVLLGPAVLGRLAPGVYRDVFVGGAKYVQQLEAQQAQTDEQLQTLEQTGVTDTAIQEQLALREQQAVVLKAELQQAQQQRLTDLTGWAGALMLAVIAVMLLEAFLGPDLRPGRSLTQGTVRVTPVLGRLITARYALAALWIALVLARPALIKQLPILFTALLIVVALGAAMIPLGKKAE